MIPLQANSNIDNSDPINFPNGRLKDNTGSGNGTPVNRNVYGDLHANISKLMRLYYIIPTGLSDSETAGYQIIESLIALASKNDYIYPLTTNGTTTLNIDIKLSLMKTNEFLVCLASTDKTTETLIKGSGPTSMAVTYSGSFKTNEYVRVIKTSGGVSIVRIADWNSLNAMATELLFLKKASQAEENAGTSDLVATTPLVNKVTFARRVNGSDSGTYLSSASQNGLMSIAQFNLLAGLVNNVKNVGWFAGFDVGGSAGALATGGDISSASASIVTSDGGIVLVTMTNPMASTNYYVRSYCQSESSNFLYSAEIGTVVFKPISNTQFEIGIVQFTPRAQSLKIHLEVVQL